MKTARVVHRSLERRSNSQKLLHPRKIWLVNIKRHLHRPVFARKEMIGATGQRLIKSSWLMRDQCFRASLNPAPHSRAQKRRAQLRKGLLLENRLRKRRKRINRLQIRLLEAQRSRPRQGWTVLRLQRKHKKMKAPNLPKPQRKAK